VRIRVPRLVEALAREVDPLMDGRRALFLAPHPDDEVLGCGGTIALKVRADADVSIAFLTDGRNGVKAAGGSGRAVREVEAMAAAAALGVPRHRLTFLRYADGRLGEHRGEAIATIRRLVERCGVEDLFVPYRREYHPDHIATWQIGRASLPPGGHLYEYPIWYGPWLWSRLRGRARLAAASHLMDAFGSVKVRVAGVAGTKRLALSAYRSQLAGFASQGAWGARFLERFSGRYEIFFVA